MNKLIFMPFVLIAVFANCLSAQNYLSKEREGEIKMSGKYYWSECSAFQEGEAKQCAFDDLKDRVVIDAVKQSIHQDEVLKAIEMGAHFDRLEQKGKIKILAWITKDSVFVTIQKPITQTPVAKPQQTSAPVAPPKVEETPQPVVPSKVEEAPQPVPVAAQSSPDSQKTQFVPPTDNPVLQKLAACKNYKEVRRMATIKGLVRGSKINSSEGFANPAQCIIAVFTDNGTLSALLDIGGSSRVDLLSGKTVQNPEQFYNPEQYFLWYLQQK